MRLMSFQRKKGKAKWNSVSIYFVQCYLFYNKVLIIYVADDDSMSPKVLNTCEFIKLGQFKLTNCFIIKFFGTLCWT